MEINFICRKGTEHFATPILDCLDQSNKSLLKIKRSLLNSKTKALISAFFSKNRRNQRKIILNRNFG